MRTLPKRTAPPSSTTRSRQKRLLLLAPSLAKRLGAYLEKLPGGEDACCSPRPRVSRCATTSGARRTSTLPSRLTLHDLRASHGTWVADRYGGMTAAPRPGPPNASVTTRWRRRPTHGSDGKRETPLLRGVCRSELPALTMRLASMWPGASAFVTLSVE